MNKISYTSGGMALYVDILQFLVTGIADSFKGILMNWGSPAGCYIVSGCVVTITGPTGGNYTYTWTAGYISYNGEILPVASGSITNVPASMPSAHGVYWTCSESVANNQSTRVGVLIYGANTDINHSGTLPLMHWDAVTLDINILNKILSGFPAQEEAWHLLASGDFQNSWANYPSGGGYDVEPVGFKKDLFGTIWLKGMTMNTGVSNSNTIFNLPVGYRPNHDRSFCCVFGGVAIEIKIAANGNVNLPNSYTMASFDGISFKI